QREATAHGCFRCEARRVRRVAAEPFELLRDLGLAREQRRDLIHAPRAVGVRERDDALVEKAVELPVADAAVDRPRATARLARLGDGRRLHVDADETLVEEAQAQ